MSHIPNCPCCGGAPFIDEGDPGHCTGPRVRCLACGTSGPVGGLIRDGRFIDDRNVPALRKRAVDGWSLLCDRVEVGKAFGAMAAEARRQRDAV